MDQGGLTARAGADQLGHVHVRPSITMDSYWGRKARDTGAAEVLEALGWRHADRDFRRSRVCLDDAKRTFPDPYRVVTVGQDTTCDAGRDHMVDSTKKWTDATREETLRKMYEAVCTRHRAIDDFRGKLLALLPIASGAAGLLILSNKDTTMTYLTAIGIYGCAVTAGLFLYELRGINECGEVMGQAAQLEKELDVPPGTGQFRDQKPRPARELVGAEMASWVVYVSVFAGWLYLAGFNYWWAPEKDSHWTAWFIVIAVVVILISKWERTAWKEKQKRNLFEQEKREKVARAAQVSDGSQESGDGSQDSRDGSAEQRALA
jgi:hypothetical protein